MQKRLGILKSGKSPGRLSHFLQALGTGPPARWSNPLHSTPHLDGGIEVAKPDPRNANPSPVCLQLLDILPGGIRKAPMQWTHLLVNPPPRHVSRATLLYP